MGIEVEKQIRLGSLDFNLIVQCPEQANTSITVTCHFIGRSNTQCVSHHLQVGHWGSLVRRATLLLVVSEQAALLALLLKYRI